MKMHLLKKRLFWLMQKRELQIIFFSSLTIFLFISLYSYHPHDSSWFFYSTCDSAIQNWCGKIGAHIAALLFYLFGSTSFLFVFLLGIIGYLIIKKRSWYDEWERVVAFVLLTCMVAAFFSLHHVVFYPHTIAGGYVGFHLYHSLYHYFDYAGAVLGIYTSILASFVIVTRLSFMPVVHYGVMGIVHAYQFMIHYRVVQRSYGITKNTLWYSSRPIVYLARFSKTILDGSAFEKTGLLVPDDEYIIRSIPKESTSSAELPVYDDPVVAYANEEQASVMQMSVRSIKQAGNTLFAEEKEQEKLFVPQRQKSYSLPHLNMFVGVADEKNDLKVQNEMKEQAKTLEEKLGRFGIDGSVVSIKRGPVVTLFEYQPAIDTKLSKILSLEDDLALALQAMSIRILAPIPGRSVVGFEVANKNRKDVLFASCIKSKAFTDFSGALPLILGEDTIGNEVVVDLAKMPHLLIAGSTGSGKSVALNAMLISLLCKCSPDDMRLILIDPKRLEFAPYADIAHLLFPIVTDPKKASPVLRWVVKQMEERYEKMASCGARNIQDYNKQMQADEKVPYIMVVIDELSDLMLTAGKEIEDLITRIAQMARAAGIHLILATQRPSVDVITGLIKVNFPSRISFRVTSKVDSRTILDCVGSEKLLGCGDMLFLNSTAATLQRVHGAYVSDKEIEQVVNHIRQERQVEYHELPPENTGPKELRDADDALYQEVLEFLQDIDDISISLLQRRFRIGYNRSARIMEILEAQGHIMPADGSKTRKVIH